MNEKMSKNVKGSIYETFSQFHPNAWDIYERDYCGVLQVDYGKEIGQQYNPVTIEQYALVCYNEFLKTRKEEWKDMFFQQVNWLVSAYDYITNDAIAIPYHFKLHDSGNPWYSGLDSAHFISIMRRAYELTQNSEFLDLMIKSKNFLILPLNKGGVLSKTPEGNVWIEEYQGSKRPHVLNGFQYIIIGLADYLECFPDDIKMREFFQDCLLSLKMNVDKYEKYFWLLYDRSMDKYRFVSTNYMPLQARKMLHLNNILKGGWKEYYWRWMMYYYISPIRYIRLLPMDWQNAIFEVIAKR